MDRSDGFFLQYTLMLTIVINRFPAIGEFSRGKALITDATLYDFFNGVQTFQGVGYGHEEMESFVSHLWHLAEVENDIDVVVHTFNPLVVNYLEDYQAIKSVFYHEAGDLKPVFGGMPGCDEKLTVMGPGEVISDTIFP